MIAWLLIGVFFFLTEGLWALLLSLGLIIFFPKLARLAFAAIAFPVWTLWCCTWLWAIGCMTGFCELSLDAWKTAFWITAVPVGIILSITGNAAIEELSL